MGDQELRLIECGIREFVEEEIGSYPFYEDYTLTHEYENIFNLEVTNAPSIVVFRGSINESADVEFQSDEIKIEVELTDSNWHEVDFFNWTVKYFWMKLLQRN